MLENFVVKILHTLSYDDVINHVKNTPVYSIAGIEDRAECKRLHQEASDETREKSVFPYMNAEIDIELVGPNVLHPTSFYVTRTGEARQQELRRQLLDEKGIDVLRLGTAELGPDERDIAGLILESAGKVYTMLPVVSETPFHEGYGKPDSLLLNNGHHRARMAHCAGKDIATVAIRGSSVPLYALANPEGWKQNRVVDEVPKIKKSYSDPNPEGTLYKLFSHGYTLPNKFPILKEHGVNVTQPR